jgi:hypothetical protein
MLSGLLVHVSNAAVILAAKSSANLESSLASAYGMPSSWKAMTSFAAKRNNSAMPAIMARERGSVSLLMSSSEVICFSLEGRAVLLERCQSWAYLSPTILVLQQRSLG